jgi:2-(1,2-epoxy-1,2-dihydrophenyl)acetyl-CoA isomerase
VADENTPDQPLLVTHDGSVATLTLNRPTRGNALTAALKEALLDAVNAASGDPEIRAVVLTGAGSAFCAGQDLAEHADGLRRDPATAFATIEQHYAPVVTALATMSKPAIAAINGTCVGAGLSLALACDLRLAAAGAKLGTAFTAIGLTCDSGLSSALVRAVGAARASELILLAEPFTAERAEQWGLVTRVVPGDELAAAASDLATRLAAGPTLAFAESKALIAAAVQPPLADVLAAEAAAQRRLGATADHAGAVDAFLSKRKPEFTGG